MIIDLKRPRFFLLLVVVFAALFMMAGCSSSSEDDSIFKDMTAKQIFDEAEVALVDEDYTKAIRYYEALDAMYPFSEYSQQGMLDSIYAYYENGDTALAAATADRYIHLYPRSDNVDYAYYMKGLADFDQPRGTLAKVLPMDASYRDPGTQAQAYTDFSALVTRYPNSRYAPDARQRMVYLRNMFAQSELNVAEFYMNRKMYVAAANRSSYIVETYPQAPQTERALVILIKADRALHLDQAADDAQKVLQASYPQSKALKSL
jgi:outer membrane protein assembly factor BamD